MRLPRNRICRRRTDNAPTPRDHALMGGEVSRRCKNPDAAMMNANYAATQALARLRIDTRMAAAIEALTLVAERGGDTICCIP